MAKLIIYNYGFWLVSASTAAAITNQLLLLKCTFIEIYKI